MAIVLLSADTIFSESILTPKPILSVKVGFEPTTIAAQSSLSGGLVILTPPTEAAVPDFPREGFSTGDPVQDHVALVAHGDPVQNNELEISGPTQFSLVAGATIDHLGTPPGLVLGSTGLGMLPGDRIKLTGPVGGEPNDGRVYTLADPNTGEVLEEIVDSDTDTTQYEFDAIRRK